MAENQCKKNDFLLLFLYHTSILKKEDFVGYVNKNKAQEVFGMKKQIFSEKDFTFSVGVIANKWGN